MNLSLDWTVIIQFSFFVACYWALKTFFFPPVLDVLMRRKKMIEEANKELRRRDAEGKKMQEEYRISMRNARLQAQEIHNTSRKEAATEERKILNQARQEAIELTNEGEIQIKERREKALKELDDQTQELASALVSKTLGRSISS